MKRLNLIITAVFLSIPLLALDYYWVGGSGNWSDLDHWVTTSGGNLQHDQIPTAEDRVIFDGNSFVALNNTITLDLDNIFARDLDFRNITQNIVLTGPQTSTINIFGSLYMHPNVTLDFEGPFEFRGKEPNQEIAFEGQAPFQIKFLSDGGWTIINDVLVDSLIRIESGSLSFGDIAVQCYRFEAFSVGNIRIDWGSVRMEVTGNRTRIMPSYEWRESLHLQGPMQTVAGNSSIRLSGIKASIGLYDHDRHAFNDMVIGRSGGDHLLIAHWIGDFRFRKLDLLGDTYLQGGYSWEQLILHGGNVYAFESNFDQRVGSLVVDTDCSKYAYIRSSQGGLSSNFIATQGVQSLEYVMLQDIHIQGAVFNATETVDLGGNNGWNITEKSQGVFYWINDSGNWDDPNHWSMSSGGPPSGCLPSAADDVIFDDASFSSPNQEVTINIPSAFCHSMDWRGIDENAGIKHQDGEKNLSLRIFGSMYFSPLLTNNFDGDINFESSHGDNEIQCAGKELNKNVNFSSASGEWTLLDELDVNDTIYFNAGSLISNDQEIECFEFFSETSSFRSLNLGASIFRLVVSTINMYWHSGLRIHTPNFNLDAGTSTVLAEHASYFDFYGNGNLLFNRVVFEGFNGVYVDDASTVGYRYGYYYHDGDFRGKLNVDTLTFSPSKAYQIFMNSEIIVDSLSAHGNCDGNIFISGYPKGIQGIIRKSSGLLQTSKTLLEGIIGTGGASFVARASQDLGNNQGWTFMEATPRTLYWVGDDGLWFEKDHWSLTSGGPGGECVPTAIDDVIFDENSFSIMYQSVGLTGSNSPICHNLTWKNAQEYTGIYDGVINITGSLELQPNVNFDPWNTTFRSDSMHNTILSGGNELRWTDFMGEGKWTFLDDMQITYQINLWSGTVVTNDFDLTTGHLHMSNYPVDFERRLELGNSHFILTDMIIWDEQIWINSNNFTIDPGNSLTEFTGQNGWIKHYGNATLQLHNVLFSNNQGLSRIEEYDQANFRFNKLEFHNNALILNSNEMDSLLLASGKIYQLQSGGTQTVHRHIRAIGNNCTPIGLESTEPGRQATIFSQDAFVLGDFINMRDQLATGGANFSAGAHSTDISNNTGWVFEDDPDYLEVGFLGEDRTLCQAEAIELSAYNYSPNETYQWNTSSTDSAIAVSTGGKYWAVVTFENNCVIRDTVNILDPLMITMNVGNDSTLCEGDEYLLNGSLNFPRVIYEWQDGTSEEEYLVTDPGEYKLTAWVDGCAFEDSVVIDYVDRPDFRLEDQQACEGDSIRLNVSVTDGEYLWSDGLTAPARTITSSGLYQVSVMANNCTSQDSAAIVFNPIPIFNLGPDTALCEETSWTYTGTIQGANYEWIDGSNQSNYVVDSAGIYWLRVTQNNCAATDSIDIQFKPLPALAVFNDTTLCEGAALTISLEEPSATYSLNGQSVSGDVLLNTSGLQSITADLNGCISETSFNLEINPIPVLELGPDSILCADQSWIFQGTLNDAIYQWSDGTSTNEFITDQSGLHWVQVTQNQCSKSDTIALTFNPLPIIPSIPDTTLCEGTSLSISLNEPDVTYQLNEEVISGQLMINETNSYQLTGLLNGCSSMTSFEVLFEPPPTVDLGGDRVLCEGDQLNINLDEPSVEYAWHDGTISGSYQINTTGQYSVEGRIFNCFVRDTILVTFNPKPDFSLGNDIILCPDEDFTLSPEIEASAYTWQDGSPGTTYSGDSPGVYWLEVVEDNCSFRDSIEVFPANPIDIRLGTDTTICDDQTYILEAAHPDAVTYSWQDGSTESSKVVEQPGLYTVEVSDGNCFYEESIQVAFKSCVYFQMYLPNAFSPNSDGVNDVFQPLFNPTIQITRYQLNIFNRWGELIHSTTDLSNGWNGLFNNDQAPAGVYVYHIDLDYVDDNGPGDYAARGDVTLIR